MTSKAVFWVVSLLTVLSVGTVAAQDRAEGRKTYLTYCSACHGESGKGDGLAAGSMAVKPTNHADGNIMNKLSDKYLSDVISKGGLRCKNRLWCRGGEAS